MYSAAIHLDGERLSLGYSDPGSGDLLAIDLFEAVEPFDANSLIKAIGNSNSKQQLKQATKNIFYSTSNRFTLIPSSFYNKDQKDAWVKPQFEQKENEIICSKFIPEINSYLLFPLEVTLKDKLKSEIGHIEFSHHFASLISIYHLFYLEKESPQAFVHFHSNQFTISLFEGKKMILFNSYELRSWEDVLYYCYYAFEQYNFSPSDTKINLGGYHPHMNELTHAFQKYSKFIYRMKSKANVQLESEKEDQLLSTIFDLQCG